MGKLMNKQSLLGSIVVTVASYSVLELIRHGLIETYGVTWLSSLGLSASMIASIQWAMIALAAVAVGWLVWKFFLQVNE